MPLRKLKFRGRQLIKTVHGEAVVIMFVLIFIAMFWGFHQIQEQRQARVAISTKMDYLLCDQDDEQNKKLREYIGDTFRTSRQLILERDDVTKEAVKKAIDFYDERIIQLDKDFPDLDCESVRNFDISP